MEFDFNINHIFTNRITKFDKRIKQFNTDRKVAAQQKDLACIVIDKLGIASSKAQGLRVPVTSTSKLKDSNHLIYLLKEEPNRTLGAAIGFLKIGSKTLFVYDNNETIHELRPMCVLDFYIHESRQRQGFGKELFDYMLQDMGLWPSQLAIDKPSFKFSSFLKKHYNLTHSIPQTNNFVIFQGFFSEQKKDNRLNKKLLHYMNHYNQGKISRNTKAEPQIPICRLNLLEKEKVFLKGEQLLKPLAQNTQPLINPPQDFPEEKVHPSITSSKPTPLDPKNSLKESHSSPVTEAIRIRTPQTTVTPHWTTPLPLAEQHSRYLSSAHGTPSEEEASNKNNNTSGTKRANVVAGSDRANSSPLMGTKLHPPNMYTNKYSYSRQHAKLLSYMDPSGIRLPHIEQDSSQHFQHDPSFPNKQINNNVPWSLFSNVAKYHSLIKRGYSHTHIW